MRSQLVKFIALMAMLVPQMVGISYGKNSNSEDNINLFSDEEELGLEEPANNVKKPKKEKDVAPTEANSSNSPATDNGQVDRVSVPANVPAENANPKQAVLQPATEDPVMDGDSTVAPLGEDGAVTNPSTPSLSPMGGLPRIAENINQDMEVIAEKVSEPNQFAGTPFIPGTMRNVAEGEAPEFYIVESGDTLFDVCSQLLDEGGYWPKLWSVNPQIKNPHFIWPGMKLSFYSGDIDTPPFLQVATEEDIVPIDKGQLVEEQLIHGEVPDMDKAFESQSVEVIGAEGLEKIEEIEAQIAVAGALFDPTSRKITLPGFLYGSEKEASGVVIGGIEGEAMIGEGKLALVTSASPLPTGTVFTVLRLEDNVRNPNTGDDIGFLYSFVANVRVTGAASGGEVSLVEVVQSRLGLQRNDVLIPFVSTARSLPITNEIGTIARASASVVAFEQSGQTVGAEGQMLYISLGAAAGIAEGQFYRIFSPPGFLATSEIKSELQDVVLPVATIRIIDTTDVGAVGYIVQNFKEIHLGDNLEQN